MAQLSTMLKHWLMLFATLCCDVHNTVSSFSTGRSARNCSRKDVKLNMFFASIAHSTSTTLDVKLTPLDGSEASIYNAAKFMVDAFWLQSAVDGSDDPSNISDAAKSSLLNIQADDLMSKYGERMGRRKLDALIVVASDGGRSNDNGKLLSAEDMLGLVTIEVRLLNAHDILSSDESERMLTQAVASLGPKQRREYKDASVLDIARELLPPEITAVCSLSNLCVSSVARRRGIAAKLCREAERLAKEELCFDEIHLRVEAKNESARKLYEDKLGYQRKYEAESARALRVDAQRGVFVEVASDILVMNKKL